MPELASKTLVLWRVRATPDRQLCCSITDRSGELVLMIHQPNADTAIISQVHPDIAALVEGSDDLRGRYLAAGWEAVDVDPTEGY